MFFQLQHLLHSPYIKGIMNNIKIFTLQKQNGDCIRIVARDKNLFPFFLVRKFKFYFLLETKNVVVFGKKDNLIEFDKYQLFEIRRLSTYGMLDTHVQFFKVFLTSVEIISTIPRHY